MFNTCSACLLGSRAPESKNRVNRSHEGDGVCASFYAATAAPAAKGRAGLYLQLPATRVSQCKLAKQKKNREMIIIMRIKMQLNLYVLKRHLKGKHHSHDIPTECFYRATEPWRRRRTSYLFDVSDKVVQRVGRSVSLQGKNT